MNWLHILSGPVVGGAIGYFTNYIAVRMLFRPRHAVKLLGRTLPFTPGVIPKRRGDLARAVAGAVERSLLSREDLAGMLASDAVCAAVADGVCGSLSDLLRDRDLGEAAGAIVGEERLNGVLESARAAVSRRVAGKLGEMNLGETISQIVGRTVLERAQGSMLAMLVTPELVASFTGPMAGRIDEYLRNEGMAQIDALIASELEELRRRPAGELLAADALRDRVAALYAGFIRSHAAGLAAHFDVAHTVEERINAMDADELEALILSVMKKELSAVVNLGAVIGLVIGILNAFI